MYKQTCNDFFLAVFCISTATLKTLNDRPTVIPKTVLLLSEKD